MKQIWWIVICVCTTLLALSSNCPSDVAVTYLSTIDPVPRNESSAPLPKWVTGTPHDFALEMKKGSKGLTDKVNHRHLFQYIYQPNLARLVVDKMSSSSRKIRMLEIGFGCAPSGGMIGGQPGGSAFGWRYLFDQVVDIEFELYVFELDEKCVTNWYERNPAIAKQVFAGDASSGEDLNRAYEEFGGSPFDVIIDDASHINWHQIKTLDTMLPRVDVGSFFVMEDIQSACHGWTVSSALITCDNTSHGNSTNNYSMSTRQIWGPTWARMWVVLATA